MVSLAIDEQFACYDAHDYDYDHNRDHEQERELRRQEKQLAEQAAIAWGTEACTIPRTEVCHQHNNRNKAVYR